MEMKELKEYIKVKYPMLDNEVKEDKPKVCKECKGTGIVFQQFGEVHTCFDCLENGRLQ